jgi:hypothetical protein
VTVSKTRNGKEFQYLPLGRHLFPVIYQFRIPQSLAPFFEGARPNQTQGSGAGVKFRDGFDIDVELVPEEAAHRGIRAGLAGVVEERGQQWKGRHGIPAVGADPFGEILEVSKIAGSPAPFGMQGIQGRKNTPSPPLGSSGIGSDRGTNQMGPMLAMFGLELQFMVSDREATPDRDVFGDILDAFDSAPVLHVQSTQVFVLSEHFSGFGADFQADRCVCKPARQLNGQCWCARLPDDLHRW